jgi:hypothetical protein
MFVHNPDKEEIVPIQSPDAKGDYSNMEIYNIKDIVKYLGVHLNQRKLQKTKFNKCRIEKVIKN